MANLIDALNERQREAVCHLGDEGVLVFAGAGTGKTRVLISRTLWLIDNGICLPEDILAVTFTTKAALEMKSRLAAGSAAVEDRVTVGTFHHVCNMINKDNSHLVDHYNPKRIINGDQQESLVKGLLENYSELSEVIDCVKFINDQKERELRARDVMLAMDEQGVDKDSEDQQLFAMAKLYEEYEKYCQEKEIVDFAEIIMTCIGLLRGNSDVRKRYSDKYKHILIDEMQDTNASQFEWLKLLDSGSNKYFAVGDDDQCIYSFRGAKRENMSKLRDDLRVSKIILLEENYRSKGNIVRLANRLISNDNNRQDKKLFTNEDDGADIEFHEFSTSSEEAGFFARLAKQKISRGTPLEEMAVLCRTRGQREDFECPLIIQNIKYNMVGRDEDGIKFLARRECKYVLLFLRIAMGQDDEALTQLIILFVKGVAERTVNKFKNEAKVNSISLEDVVFDDDKSKLVKLRNYVFELRELYEGKATLGKLVECIVKSSPIAGSFKLAEQKWRRDNLSILGKIAHHYVGDAGDDKVKSFISYGGDDLLRDENNPVAGINLMTVHAAKGLEYDHVYIPGLAQNIFPGWQELKEKKIDEERRLLYVAITRAKKTVNISFAEWIVKKEKAYARSTFIGEMGIETAKRPTS